LSPGGGTMEEKSKQIGQNRAFLNIPYDTSLSAMIGYNVSVETWRDELIKEKLYDSSSIEFNISDCNRKISLEFDVETKEQMRNSFFKLNTIINICESMKADLKTARLLIRKGIERRDELDAIKQKSK